MLDASTSLLLLLSPHEENLDGQLLGSSCSEVEATYTQHSREEVSQKDAQQTGDQSSSLCVDVELLWVVSVCGRLERRCWMTTRSVWLGSPMWSSPSAIRTSAAEHFLLRKKRISFWRLSKKELYFGGYKSMHGSQKRMNWGGKSSLDAVFQPYLCWTEMISLPFSNCSCSTFFCNSLCLLQTSLTWNNATFSSSCEQIIQASVFMLPLLNS